MIRFMDMDESSRALFDERQLKIFVEEQIRKEMDRITKEAEKTSEDEAAKELLSKGYLPAKDTFANDSGNLTWMSAKKLIADTQANLLPGYFGKFIESEKLVYNLSVQEYTYNDASELEKQIAHWKEKIIELEKGLQNMKSGVDALTKLKGMDESERDYQLYKHYLEGWNLGKDDSFAFEYLQKSYNSGYHKAVYAMAKHKVKGDICPKDVNGAVEIYQKLCQNNELKAMFAIAELYFYEKKFHNEEEAVNYCMMAFNVDSKATVDFMMSEANLGHPICSHTLAKLFIDGKLSVDDKKAIEILELAMSQESLDAKIYLADVFRNGKMGVEKDLGKAMKLYGELAKVGVKGAQETYNVIYKQYYNIRETISVRVCVCTTQWLADNNAKFDRGSEFYIYSNGYRIDYSYSYYQRCDFNIKVKEGDEITAKIEVRNKYGGVEYTLYSDMWKAIGIPAKQIICKTSNKENGKQFDIKVDN